MGQNAVRMIRGANLPRDGVTAAGLICRAMASPQQQLWLLRHGEAVPHESKPDSERELTARGERQAVAAGEALARLGLELDACYTSPKVRAIDTAKLACRALGTEPIVEQSLGSGFDR